MKIEIVMKLKSDRLDVAVVAEYRTPHAAIDGFFVQLADFTEKFEIFSDTDPGEADFTRQFFSCKRFGNLPQTLSD